MSFDKVFKKNANDVKSMASTMISNGNQFCALVLDPSTTISSAGEESTVYPTNSQVQEFLQNLMTKELAYKPLPERAIEEMKRKGQEPKKQPSEIMLCIIVPSETDVYLLVHNPFSHIDSDQFIKSVFTNTENSQVPDLVPDTKYIVTLKHDTPFKYSDEILRNVFATLKKFGVYKEESEDDEPMNFDNF